MRVFVFILTSSILIFFGTRALAYNCYSGNYEETIVNTPQVYCAYGHRSLYGAQQIFNKDMQQEALKGRVRYLPLIVGECKKTLIVQPVQASGFQAVKRGRYYSFCALIQTQQIFAP